MAQDKNSITIKKYANRRLYNTSASVYVTLEDLAELVKKGDDFIVLDAKSGDDITRSVLTQIIFEQEGKDGQSLLPITFLRQLIRFYGDSMQMLVPSYLEFTIDRLTGEQHKFRDQLQNVFGIPGTTGQGLQAFGPLEEQARKNMAMFAQALTLFNPFAAPGLQQANDKPESAAVQEKSAPDLDGLRKQMDDMQKKIEALSKKP